MVIDGGNVADDQLAYSLLTKIVPDRHVKYYVGTHDHENHLDSGASVLTAVRADTLWCPNNDATQKFFGNFLKKADAQGKTPVYPKVGTKGTLGSATFTVLGPEHPDATTPNNTSIVIRVVHCKNVFLFTGDCEREEEREILKRWKTSVLQGDVTCVSDGKTVTFSTEKGVSATKGRSESSVSGLVKPVEGNRGTMKYHLIACKYAPGKSNRVDFKNPEAAEEARYAPCKVCKPSKTEPWRQASKTLACRCFGRYRWGTA